MSNSSAAETINAYGPISSPHIVFSDIFSSSRRSSMASHATDSRKNSVSEQPSSSSSKHNKSSKSSKSSSKKTPKVPTLFMPSIRWVN
ncbi:hypothetical protein JDV02_007745 [Purpureocillium takamizusanense]|uniref:Uncharacterized protein n=1 Tax=Purpureocillium takamizusanense TaxID=2060973 RepID=A0A9Q8QIU6_9HYPO|nr:uncharacterized protein JDV02_007745 [Purpureocillium takamizusanense]UNI21789.1 hypothetical protein JDV02_007745 [Purpureocillium takamizusanense]